MMKDVYEDAFVLHEDSNLMAEKEDKDKDPKKTDMAPDKRNLIEDPRKEMDDTWVQWWKFQPLWKIRNYFGEKIGLYFAWAGMLLTSLWLPMLFGVACFIYGLTVRYTLTVDRDINPLYTVHPKLGALANSEDPDQMQPNAAFDRALHCLLR